MSSATARTRGATPSEEPRHGDTPLRFVRLHTIYAFETTYDSSRAA